MEFWDELDFDSEHLERIIGNEERNLRRLEADYNVAFKKHFNKLCIKGGEEEKKRAIKDIENSLLR